LEEFVFDVLDLGAKGPAKEVQRLKDARLSGGVRTDEDGEPLQIDMHLAEAFEIADRHFADHGLAALNLSPAACFWQHGTAGSQEPLSDENSS
jgi:hypothetical protein